MAIKSNHWYSRDGSPCYELPNISKGGMRSVTLADARKLNLVPSVTTIGKIVYAGGLQNWIKEQIVKAAWDIPKNGDGYDVWADKVYTKADEISQTAADTGSAIHEAIEQFLASNGRYSGQYADWQRAFANWWDNQEWNAKNKRIVVNCEDYIPTDYGYGGRYDIAIGGDYDIIIDIKTQNAKGKKFTFYRSWGRQLAAYAQALQATRLINVALDSQDSSKLEAYEWQDYHELLKEFQAAQLLWCAENNYYPQLKEIEKWATT